MRSSSGAEPEARTPEGPDVGVAPLEPTLTSAQSALRPSTPLTAFADSTLGASAPEVALRSSPQVRDPARYRILGEHGRGGLGRVSRAHDRELGRDVAIKELLERGHVHEVRFAREALITARLEHPGIVPIHEAGRWPDGTPFYAMKLVSGRPLRELIAERPTVEERLGLLHHVIAVADAIAYAHGKHIIHRDLKPGNVIVGEFGETVVIDWGLAKEVSDPADEAGGGGVLASDDDLTSAGTVLGTPAYMAPEQARGERVDQRADVFAIGAMLWELCALQKVPPEDAGQRHRILRRSGIDEDLIAIIDKAIDPDAQGRYQDAGELAADLKAFKSGARIAARSYSLFALLVHWTRRHRALAVTGLAFCVLVVVSVIALGVLYRASSRNADAARRNAVTARARLVHSYAEQGRHALLDGRSVEALIYLAQALRGGEDTPAVRFMLARTLQPRLAERVRLRASSERMWSARFSPDGRRIVTTDDRVAEVRDAETSRLLFKLPHSDIVWHVLFSPDATKLITVGNDGSVKIWDAASGQLVRQLTSSRENGTSSYRVAAISPDGHTLAALDRDAGAVHVWNVRDGRLLAALPIAPHDVPVQGDLSFSHDGRWLAAAVGTDAAVFDTRIWKRTLTLAVTRATWVSFDPSQPRLLTGTAQGDVSLWSIPDGARVNHLLEIGEPISDLAFSRNGELVAAGRKDGTILVWHAQSGQLRAQLAHHGSGVQSIEFDPTSRLLVSGGRDGKVIVADVELGLPVTVLEGATHIVDDVHFDPGSRHVIGTSRAGTAHVWDASPVYRRWSSPEIDWSCGSDVTLDGDHRVLAMNCGKHGTRVWDTSIDRQIADLPGVIRAESGLNRLYPAISAEGDLIAIPRGQDVELFALPGGRLVRTLRHSAQVSAVRFAPRGHTLVTGTRDGVLRVTRDGHEPAEVPFKGDAIDTVGLLADGRIVAIDAGKRLAILDPDRAVVLKELTLPGRAMTFRISPDGHRLVTIPVTITPSPPVLCDLEQGRIVALLEGHGSQVYSVRFVRDGREILTAGADGSARLWDGITGRARQTFPGNIYLFDATLSPDGSLVGTAGGDGNLRFWDTASGSMLWMLRAHKSIISALQFDGGDLITRGAYGDLARWHISQPASSMELLGSLDRVLRCLPLRFDETTGGLVGQKPVCDGAVGGPP